jgi:L-cysteine:1D-myo-inositol 2-amino-2-deoxy-alpha-D-glucopyranoside ligase
MRSWPAPEMPTLPVHGPAVSLHDTVSGALVPTRPEGRAGLYVCGITPYDATHIGHAATYVAFDLLNRAWRNAGHDVTYVQNVTDVDDPLLERADKVKVDWVELAERETELFRQDMAALRVIPPDHYIGAVESIPLVIDLIRRLEAVGAVYRVDNDVYYSVTADPTFGQVSGLDRDEMLRLYADRGGDPDREGKKDPLDCVLWRAERPGEPAWDSAYGRGRPGWHVECTAMAMEYLGTGFDVQGGGSDLAFPHHEMCAGEAQVAVPGTRFAQVYAHAGMVGYDGEKMSKSKGNLVFVSQLRNSDVDPVALRLTLLRHHYRSDWEWTDQLLWGSVDTLADWRKAPAHLPLRWWRASSAPSPTTWTPRARLRPSTPGWRRR